MAWLEFDFDKQSIILDEWLINKCAELQLVYKPVKWRRVLRNGNIGIGAPMHDMAKANNMTPEEFIDRILNGT